MRCPTLTAARRLQLEWDRLGQVAPAFAAISSDAHAALVQRWLQGNNVSEGAQTSMQPWCRGTTSQRRGSDEHAALVRGGGGCQAAGEQRLRRSSDTVAGRA